MNEAIRKIEAESFAGRLQEVGRKIAEAVRNIWKALLPALKRLTRKIVEAHLQHEDPQVRAAAIIWLRSKNRRIRQKQIRILFSAYEMEGDLK